VNTVQDPRTYIGKFWVDGITHDEHALRYLVDVMGADKVAYGTDYPFPLGDLDHGRFIEEHPQLRLEVKEQLLSKSVCDFLRIDVMKFQRNA
jgi:aminocarboxymuconate-semialdehyde decarboxylase